jgi:AcrR family transcriptional regulator
MSKKSNLKSKAPKSKAASKAKTKPKAKAKPQAAAPEIDLRDELLTAAMDIAATEGWEAVSSERLADELGIAREDVLSVMPDKTDILRWLGANVDAAMHAAGAPEGSAREQLFELFMRRFDALAPYKEGVYAVAQYAKTSAQLGIALAPNFARSMADVLALADLPRGPLHRIGLGVLALAVFNIWLEDDTIDLSPTMAALDRRLGQLEEAAEFLSPFLGKN